MKKLYARIVPLVFVLGACSSSDEPAADPSVPVGFSVQTETRAAVTGTTLPNGSLFKVWGGYDGNNVFDGREVTKTASGCTYTGTEYWVPGKTYNFHAVYPAELPAEATLTVADDGTVSVSNFDCSATGDAAVDLMTASAPDDIKADEIIASPNSVELTFSHLLSHISFVFANELTGGYEAEVTDISFLILVKGNYNSSTEASPWTNLTPGAITLYPAAAPLKVANGSKATSDPALVIPQSNKRVNVTFTVTIREKINEATGSTTMTVVKRFTSPLATTDGEWKMGQRYEYKATLTDELMEMDGLKLTQITLNVTITNWDQENANVSWGGETAAP